MRASDKRASDKRDTEAQRRSGEFGVATQKSTLAVGIARCSYKATNARTEMTRASQVRMLQKSCRVAG